MEDVLVLLVAGVPVAVSVMLGVQGLKVFGFVNGDTAARAAVVLGLVFGLGALSVELFPAAARFIELGFVYFNGAMVAGLFYEYIASPILEKLGLNISSKSLK